MIYMDYNATSPMKPAVRVAMLEAMERHGNPSSVHRYGRIARRYVEEGRAAVAALVGVKPAQVVFTGSGTEANNMVFKGSDKNFITSTIEHDSVLASSPNALRLPVNELGLCDLIKAEAILKTAPQNSLVSLMLVNNETGVIQPVTEIAPIAKRYGHLVHTDAVQAAGRLPIDFKALSVDYLTLSAHKIGGPQGIGALILSEKVVLKSLIVGGGQEMNRRAGTENIAAIVGFGIAAQLAADDLRDVPRLASWRDQLQNECIKIGGGNVVAIASEAPRIAGTVSLALPTLSSETQVMALDLAGFAVSAGSACSSGKVKTSHVIKAMGFSDTIASSTIRVSLGWNTSLFEIAQFIEAYRTLYQRTSQNQQSKAA